MSLNSDRVSVRNTDPEHTAADIRNKPSSGAADTHALYVQQGGTSGTGSGLKVESNNSSTPALIVQGGGDLLDLRDSSGASQLTVANDGSLTFSGTLTPNSLDITGAAAGSDLVTLDVTGDTQRRLILNADGTAEWGSGSAAVDTNLYRSAADTLKTDDTFIAADINLTGAASSTDILTAQVTGDTQKRFILNAGGGLDFGPGNGAVDVNLYRDSANLLFTDDSFTAAGNITAQGTLNATGTTTLSGDLAVTGVTTASTIAQTVAATTTDALNIKVTGDTQQRLIANGNGTLEWGSGSAAVDVNLYRSAANILGTDDELHIVRTADTDTAQSGIVTGDGFDRYRIRTDGRIDWGPGTGTRDTNLYRSAANALATDDALAVAGNAIGQFTPPSHGMLAWSYDPAVIVSGSTLTGGTVYLTKVLLSQSATATKLYWQVSGAGVTPTAGQNEVGIYNSSGTLLATTNVDSVISTTGLKTTTIASTALTAGSFYWVAMVFNAATIPGVSRAAAVGGAGSLINAGLSASAYRFAINGTSQTILPASVTPASNTQTSFAGPWVAVGV